MKLHTLLRSWVSQRIDETTLIRQYFRRHRRYLVNGVGALICVNSLLIIQPLILKSAVDGLLQDQAISIVSFWAFLYLIISIAQAVCRYGWRVNLQTGSVLAELDLRRDYTAKLFKLPLDRLQHYDSGQLLARANSDVEAVSRVFDAGMIVFVDAFLYVLLVPIIMFVLSPALTVLALAPIPIILMILWCAESLIKHRYALVQGSFGGLIGLARGVLRGMRHVRATASEGSFLAAFEKRGEEYVRQSLRLAVVESAFAPTLDMMVVLGVFAVFWVGGGLVFSDVLTIGTFVAFQQYLLALRWPAQALGISCSVYQRGVVSSARLQDVLSEVQEDERDQAYVMQPCRLEVKDLSYTYPGSPEETLRSVSFTLEPGERVAVLGDVGAGKSTLLHILGSVIPCASGTVFIQGEDLSEMSLGYRRKLVRMVPQSTYVFNASVKDNLELGRESEVSEFDLDRVCRFSHILDEVRSMPGGYNTLLGEHGVMLSGGQRQRLTIARALLQQASLILFDDALSSIDVATEKIILGHLEEMRGTRSEVIVTHRLSTAARADKLLIIEKGQVTGFGTHQDLMESNEWYHGFVQRQILLRDIYDFANSQR
jgi:ATP-binding cassette subfamily B multidrug efflux pump